MRLAVLLAASLACVGIGFAKSAALSAHVKDLETLQKIIQYLRGEIVTAASPLPGIRWLRPVTGSMAAAPPAMGQGRRRCSSRRKAFSPPALPKRTIAACGALAGSCARISA